MDPEEIRSAIGSTSMNVMDVVDHVVSDQIGVLAREVLRLKDQLIERGLDEPHAIQLVVSFATGAAVHHA